ncbi:glycosyl transferase [Bacteroidia bacterium]|nr:glycosyl transferase [Bacteroidia bacterium]GHT03271.1 glycosyl transferase [Bacteroidia bacterium]GHT45562.1 glycosyl transferase [Bacteroidia bacterium]
MKKRRIYIFNKTAKGANYGIGTYIKQLTTVLKDSDLDVTIVHLYTQGNEMDVEEKQDYRQIYIPSPSSRTKNSRSYYNRNIAYLLKEFISDDKETEIIFQLNFMDNEDLIVYLKEFFKCKTILVAHYTDWSFALFGDYARLKVIVERPPSTLKKPVEKSVEKNFKGNLKMIKKADKFVCVAKHTSDIFQSLGNVSKEKIEIINNALEDVYIPLTEKKKTALRKKYCIDENTKIILFVGRLDDVKGVNFLIKAFQRVIITHSNVRLFIAGDTIDFKDLLKESADCWSKISFTGFLEKKTLYEFYQIADIGVVCSLHEEFGLVAIEMMMHTLPLIVTKTGGLDEIVEDTVSGLKVPVRTIRGKRQVDVKCLADKMAFLLDNPMVAKELGVNGRKRFLEKYGLSLFSEKMLNLYNNL